MMGFKLNRSFSAKVFTNKVMLFNEAKEEISVGIEEIDTCQVKKHLL